METKTIVNWWKNLFNNISVDSYSPLQLVIFRTPKKVINTINSLQRNFLWGIVEERRKLSWIKWNSCCLPKDKGGLEIKNIENFNSALVGKWLWRILNEIEAMWVRVIEAKYGRSEGWMNEGGSKKGSTW